MDENRDKMKKRDIYTQSNNSYKTSKLPNERKKGIIK